VVVTALGVLVCKLQEVTSSGVLVRRSARTSQSLGSGGTSRGS
jgi:hypothetical protein